MYNAKEVGIRTFLSYGYGDSAAMFLRYCRPDFDFPTQFFLNGKVQKMSCYILFYTGRDSKVSDKIQDARILSFRETSEMQGRREIMGEAPFKNSDTAWKRKNIWRETMNINKSYKYNIII